MATLKKQNKDGKWEYVEVIGADIVSQLDKKANKIIKDDAANKQYELGIKNGLLYYREVL